MERIAVPERADNAENAIKCAICGNAILVGDEDGLDQRGAICDVCRNREALKPDRIAGVSNEEY